MPTILLGIIRDDVNSPGRITGAKIQVDAQPDSIFVPIPKEITAKQDILNILNQAADTSRSNGYFDKSIDALVGQDISK